MKNIYLFFTSVIILLILSSCSKDSTSEIEVEKEVCDDLKKEVIINAYFYNITGEGSISTRAIGNSWEDGDSIGLFMKKAGSVLSQNTLEENVQLRTDGTNRFTYLQEKKVYFPFNKEKVDFISYYPYRSSLDGLNFKIDVSDQSNLSAIDLMYSDNAKNKNSDNNAVDLNFEHQLTKVVFTIDVNNSGKDLSDISAKITNINSIADFSLIDGTIANKGTPKDVTLNANDNGTILQGILLPENDLSNKSLVIDIAGTTYTYPLNSTNTIKAFEKSKKCTYKITLNSGQGPIIESVNATITDWIIVSEDIIITEDPLETSPEENNPKPDEGGDTGSPDVDGDSNTIPPQDGDDTVTPEEPNEEQTTPNIEDGDGTQENPYNITQAIAVAKSLSRYEIKTRIWVKGYIVGHYTDMFYSKFVNSVENACDLNFALARSPEENDFQNTFHVNFMDKPAIKTKINLKSNSDHFKKEITLLGSINYLSTTTNGEIYGMEKITRAIINGETYPN